MKFLSSVGCFTVIRSTLNNLENHIMKFTILTSKVINNLEKLQHIFVGSTPISVNFIQSNGILLKLLKITVDWEFNLFPLKNRPLITNMEGRFVQSPSIFRAKSLTELYIPCNSLTKKFVSTLLEKQFSWLDNLQYRATRESL